MDIQINEAAVPVDKPVRGACELLGFDPLFVANEGCAALFFAPDDVPAALETLRRHPVSSQSVVIGEAAGPGGAVSARTALGTVRRLAPPSGEQLPRIC